MCIYIYIYMYMFVVYTEDCTQERYHCLTKPEIVISPAVRVHTHTHIQVHTYMHTYIHTYIQVYDSDRIPAPYTSSDFVRVVNSDSEINGEVSAMSDWTETETLRLLEALEQYGEDWVQVCVRVDMCVCRCVCVYVCVCVYIYIYIYACVCMHVCVCISETETL